MSRAKQEKSADVFRHRAWSFGRRTLRECALEVSPPGELVARYQRLIYAFRRAGLTMSSGRVFRSVRHTVRKDR